MSDESTERPEAERQRLTAERDRLQAALDTAYGQLSEVTSRVLAMSEASDSLVQTHEAKSVGGALLSVAGRAVGAKTGGVFVSRGEGAFDLVATLGMDDASGDLLSESLPDLAMCHLVEGEGKAYQWSIWAMTELEEPLLTALMHRMFLPEDQRDPKKAADAEQRAKTPLAVLEGQLQGDWLAGNDFTVADLNVSAVLSWAVLIGMDLSAFPKTQAWLGRCTARPGYMRLISKMG